MLTESGPIEQLLHATNSGGGGGGVFSQHESRPIEELLQNSNAESNNTEAVHAHLSATAGGAGFFSQDRDEKSAACLVGGRGGGAEKSGAERAMEREMEREMRREIAREIEKEKEREMTREAGSMQGMEEGQEGRCVWREGGRVCDISCLSQSPGAESRGESCDCLACASTVITSSSLPPPLQQQQHQVC